ncbi:MAG: tRNA 2-thiouridine(34) synthase MnmA [SAR202 cluster bacterium]|nr:tRNA 2-thiouridine(34) synthase MnmA [SAR202 cluster bacterium]
MSGGVDSSVAAVLLKQAGYDVVGVTMRLWSIKNDSVSTSKKPCCSVEDIDDARRVCQKLNIPHYVQNFEKEFQEHVVDYFCREYDNGRTPHPCLACNDRIKFDFLLRRAMFLDADYIATGHYARIVRDTNSAQLCKAVDATKDQSYVLFTLSQAEIDKLLLPVGEYSKTEIREIANNAGLAIADKPDSQEICFIPDNNYRKFISTRIEPKPGKFVDKDGNVIGDHPGVQFFTIGQRRKLGLQGNSPTPYYVTNIDSNSYQVTLGSENDLYRTRLWASRVNFVSGTSPKKPIEVAAKIRYKAGEAPALLTPHGNWVDIEFTQPQRAITPGQAVVFYKNEAVIGGGYIETSRSPSRERKNILAKMNI